MPTEILAEMGEEKFRTWKSRLFAFFLEETAINFASLGKRFFRCAHIQIQTGMWRGRGLWSRLRSCLPFHDSKSYHHIILALCKIQVSTKASFSVVFNYEIILITLAWCLSKSSAANESSPREAAVWVHSGCLRVSAQSLLSWKWHSSAFSVQ